MGKHNHQRASIKRPAQAGFTIVELLIVVVVIAILAAVTIVAYSGIQNRTKQSAAQSDVSQSVKKVLAYAVQNNEQYPADITSAASAGVAASAGNVVNYLYNYDGTGNSFCVTVTNSTGTYYATNADATVKQGGCLSSSGLLAWWPMNGNAADVSGNGKSGTVVGGSTAQGQSGQAGGSYLIPGGTASIIVPSVSLVGTPFTATAWVYINSFTGAQNQTALFGSAVSGGSNAGLHLGVRSAAPYMGYFGSDYASGTTLSVGQWYFLSYVQNSDSTRRIYINGNPAGTSGTMSAYQSTFDRLGNSCCMEGAANARLDDMRVYGRALTPAEITALYTAGAL